MKQALLYGAAALAAALLVAPGVAGAPSTAVSAEAVMDTRTRCTAFPAEGARLDSRSFTADLSDDIRLNTRKIVGSIILLR